VFRIATKNRLPLQLIAGVLGTALLIFLIHRAGPAKLVEHVAALGWGLALVIALGGVSHLVKTWAWRLTLIGEEHHVSFPRMLGLRLGSEAVGQLGMVGQVFGETLRVALLSPTMPLASGISSVTLDRALFILTAALASLFGMVAILLALPLSHALALYGVLCAITLLGVVLLMALAVRRRWGVLSGTARVLGRVRYFRDWVERKLSTIDSVENKLLDFYHSTPRAFWGSFALNLACQGMAVLEVYLILWLMGANLSLFAALAIEALTKLVNIVGMFNPGNIGTYEGGNMLIVRMFGLSGAAGLTLSVTRRLRALFWAAVGSLCLVMLSRSRKPNTSDDSTHASTWVPEEPASPREPQNKNDSAHHSHVAVILAYDLPGCGGFGSLLPRVGTLPVLLRAILGAQKAGATRIVAVVDPVTGRGIRRELLNTGRLPESVEWVEFGSGEASLPLLFQRILPDMAESRLVLIAGDRTYHPSLQQRAGEWNGEYALALMTGSQLVGINALSRDLAIEVARHCPANAATLENLQAWLSSTHSVQCEPVEEYKWQRVLTPQQRLLAEQKLDGWLVKPTDGIFARMNRRISIPISRQIIKFPITPNMVSLFTLGVSFVSGVSFAYGGYRHMLAGAILSLFASILDGCDGEVARLKLQESEFGCWLETICDYLYYLFIFAGMTIGLWRSSGMRSYLVLGCLLFTGAVASFLTIGLQRRQLASGRPEQYLGIWQTQATRRRSNPLLFLGRHTEFLIRRCFLPYAFLFFALFGITKVAFVLCAVGANLVWPIALYSSRAFRQPRVKLVSANLGA
jgi:uncharacterized protein (TIRG00374 family)